MHTQSFIQWLVLASMAQAIAMPWDNSAGKGSVDRRARVDAGKVAKRTYTGTPFNETSPCDDQTLTRRARGSKGKFIKRHFNETHFNETSPCVPDDDGQVDDDDDDTIDLDDGVPDDLAGDDVALTRRQTRQGGEQFCITLGRSDSGTCYRVPDGCTVQNPSFNFVPNAKCGDADVPLIFVSAGCQGCAGGSGAPPPPPPPPPVEAPPVDAPPFDAPSDQPSTFGGRPSGVGSENGEVFERRQIGKRARICVGRGLDGGSCFEIPHGCRVTGNLGNEAICPDGTTVPLITIPGGCNAGCFTAPSPSVAAPPVDAPSDVESGLERRQFSGGERLCIPRDSCYQVPDGCTTTSQSFSTFQADCPNGGKANLIFIKLGCDLGCSPTMGGARPPVNPNPRPVAEVPVFEPEVPAPGAEVQEPESADTFPRQAQQPRVLLGGEQICIALAPGDLGTCYRVPQGCSVEEPTFNFVPKANCPGQTKADLLVVGRDCQNCTAPRAPVPTQAPVQNR